MPKNEKVADLSTGLQVWKLVVSSLKEQEINAQVMDDRKMKILTANIKNRGALESLPLVYKDGESFTIISGHHRVKAAAAAGLETIYGLVETNKLTDSQIISKQIGHNELVGEHDSEILAQLVKKMKEADDLMASGLPEKYLNSIQSPGPVMDLPALNFDWRSVTLSFLPEGFKDFEFVVKSVDSKTALLGVAPLSMYEDFVQAMLAVGRIHNIKSIGSVIQFLTEVAKKEVESWQTSQSTTNNTTSPGSKV